MNIEDVKGRLVTLQNVSAFDRDEAMKIVKEYIINYNNDVGYLLSIINQAETALSRIADLHIRGIEDRAAEPHREIAKEALKVMRGN